MAPPTFKKVSKKADGLFNDDFGASVDKVTFKSKTDTGLGLKIEGSRSKGPLSGLIETTWNAKCNVSVKEKWTTKNVVTTEIGLNDKLLKNSDVTVSADITPTTHVLNSWAVKTKYTTDSVTTNFDLAPKSATFAGVFSYKNFNLGAKVASPFDFSKFDVNFVGSYSTGGLVLTTAIQNSGNVSGSVYHAVCDKLTVGAKFGWSRSSDSVTFGAASQYVLDKDTTLKAKVDQGFNLNLSLLQTLNKNVSARVSADVPVNGETKLGLHVTINA